MVRIADRQIEPDHVVRHRHARIQRRRAGVIAMLDADPGDTDVAGFLDRFFRREAHHQMAHAVVAVDQRHTRRFALDADMRRKIDRVALDAADVLRQAEHAVAVGAQQVGAHLQFGNTLGFGDRYSDRFIGAHDKGF